ncbi:hypothetical protein L210DRAFT_878797 [Boletus edulis BED1]|uniref:Uncharacterized protein n=1 Tax=Boletus edulis BED1 TaxID=1328754 RepID=A0AAD4GAF1_BOLED|nr:hypothetical protein L210DRAFT_878797 [Boletus edulis BED1]
MDSTTLEITFAPNGRRGDDAPCKFEFTECGPGLVAVIDALKSELIIAPTSPILHEWVEDLLQVAEYHYRLANREVSVSLSLRPR